MVVISTGKHIFMHKELKERELENPDHYQRPKEYQNAASLCYRE